MRFHGVVIGATMAVLAGAPTQGQEQCLAADAPATLTGFLVTGIFPGPPEFGSVQKGDAPYEAQFLYMLEPVCTGAVGPLQIVQLACADTPLAAGEAIAVSGTLFEAHTGYHRAPLLLACD
ncbi:hypothetical protein DEVEQU_01936 [Devosia equisanguinis]|uniref:DUF4431 domain-containing protein n=1 Tax=Devosia equisanguinis TaxID=2490941 RepID=A0A3S5D3E9_9HYPH|nr:hypothetical protein [Devosia equisanguinis]VDS04796.1 hypothetical protein DEVEQU_01936 [Devosia equisanguinis]